VIVAEYAIGPLNLAADIIRGKENSLNIQNAHIFHSGWTQKTPYWDTNNSILTPYWDKG